LPQSDQNQQQTAESFGYKWNQTHSYASEASLKACADWQLERYGFSSQNDMQDWFSRRERILDAGCGSGLGSSAWNNSSTWQKGRAQWIGLDISSAIHVAQDRLKEIPRTWFVQADLMHPPFAPSSFDTLFSEGVLHHTPDAGKALEVLVELLKPGGEALFYVYRKKGPVREFTDDYIRNQISDQTPAEAWETLRSLTRLGQQLAELNVQVEIPEAIPILGIPAGKMDVQRLIYWNFAKLFWNPTFSFEENLHVNFDWYHPKYAHRYTEEQVRGWCTQMKLDIHHFHAAPSGWTVRAVRRS